MPFKTENTHSCLKQKHKHTLKKKKPTWNLIIQSQFIMLKNKE